MEQRLKMWADLLLSYYDELLSAHAQVDHVSLFYGLLAASTSASTVSLSYFTHEHNFHSKLNRAVLVAIPSWLPTRALTWLNTYCAFYLANLVPLVAGIAAAYPTPEAKLFVAVFYSLFALADSSVTNSHRDYANTYTCWCIALLPDDYVEPIALALCVHYLSSAGFSKILVGGHRWGSGKTLSSILECYVELSIAEGGPAIKPLGLFLQRSLSLCSVASISTLIFEAILVPLAFALPLEVRLLLVPISMGFHFGIGLTQSLVIGICFSPCLATYVFAFGANVEVLSTPWCVSVALYLLIQGYVFSRGNLLPEDWPITSFPLFPWNYEQNAFLNPTFVTGSTRLVIATEDHPATKLLGVSILEKYDRQKVVVGDSIKVYNAWEQLLGDTLIYNTMMTDICKLLSTKDMKSFVEATTRWLSSTRRIAEVHSGRYICKAWFVKVDDEGRIVEVIH